MGLYSGQRRIFLLGLIIFTAASFLAAISTSLPMLICARAVQAAGAAAMTPTSLGLIITVVEPARRPLATRLWVSSNAVAAGLGPVIGGFLTQVSWTWVFLINVPIGVALIAVAWKTVPATTTGADGRRVNLLGALWAIVAVGGLSLALVEGPSWGWTSPLTVACVVVSIVGIFALSWDSRRSATPLIPSAILRVRSFGWANVTMLLFSISFASGLLCVTLWLQGVWDYSPLQTGLAIAPGPLMVPIFALGGQRVLGRMSPETRAALGSFLWAAGTVLILVTATETPDYIGAVLPGWLIAGVGVGLTLPAILGSATNTLPAQYASAGSAVVNVARQVGTAIGVSVLVAILVADEVATRGTFQIAWWTVAVTGVIAALTAGRMAHPAALHRSGDLHDPDDPPAQ